VLAACQKYDMASVQSFIRTEVSHGAFPMSKGAEAFAAYAIAFSKSLIPEMENAARQTLVQPMTFESLGENLRLFDDSALRDLARFRRRYRDSLVAFLDSFFKGHQGLLKIWVGCPEGIQDSSDISDQIRGLPKWLIHVILRCRDDLKGQKYTDPLDIRSRIRREHSKALQTHLNCEFCMRVQIDNGSTYFASLEEMLAQVRERLCFGPLVPGSHLGVTSRIKKSKLRRGTSQMS